MPGIAELPEVELVQTKFIADRLMQEGFPATADTHDLRIVFAGFFGLVPAGPYFGLRVWVRNADLPRARTWLGGYEQRRRAKRECSQGGHSPRSGTGQSTNLT